MSSNAEQTGFSDKVSYVHWVYLCFERRLEQICGLFTFESSNRLFDSSYHRLRLGCDRFCILLPGKKYFKKLDRKESALTNLERTHPHENSRRLYDDTLPRRCLKFRKRYVNESSQLHKEASHAGWKKWNVRFPTYEAWREISMQMTVASYELDRNADDHRTGLARDFLGMKQTQNQKSPSFSVT